MTAPAGAAPQPRGRWAVVVWLAVVAVVGYVFALLDWDWGVLRGCLLLLAIGAALGLQRVRRRQGALALPRWLTRALAGLAAVLVLYHGYVAVDWIVTTKRADTIKLDQGQILYRAIRFFPEINPYGRGVLLDPVYYIVLIDRHYPSGCVHFSVPPPAADAAPATHEAWRRHMLSLVTRYWWHYDLDAARQLMPEIAGGAECERTRDEFESLGFKYGPVTLASFVPGVLLFGKAGVFVSQTLLFGALCALVCLIALRRGDGEVALAFTALTAMLAVPLLRNNLLLTSALDGVPTALCLLALWCWLSGRHAWTAAALGLALSAKLLPSLLYLPLLATLPRRRWPLFGACAVLPYVPVALSDLQGLFNNVVMFPLVRGTNTTSLAHYLPDGARLLYTGTCGAFILYSLYRTAREGFSAAAVMRYLLVAHLALLAGSSILHNNYTIWFAPLLALFTVELMVAGSEHGTPETQRGSSIGWPASSSRNAVSESSM